MNVLNLGVFGVESLLCHFTERIRLFPALNCFTDFIVKTVIHMKEGDVVGCWRIWRQCLQSAGEIF